MARTKRRFKFKWELVTPYDRPSYRCADMSDQFGRSEDEMLQIEVRRYPASLTTSIKLMRVGIYDPAGKAFFKIETKRTSLDAPLDLGVYNTWEKLILQKIWEMRLGTELEAGINYAIEHNPFLRKISEQKFPP